MSGVAVAVEVSGTVRKVCRLWFGPDGSYYVSSPYHPFTEAALLKLTWNYSLQEQSVPFEETITLASLDDDDRALKLSHHPSGLVQFSGSGVASGEHADGTHRGVGVRSWPLNAPASGPAFIVSVTGVDWLTEAPRGRRDLVLFDAEDLSLVPGWDTIVVEGHYFPPLWRRFVRKDAKVRDVIGVVHPAGVVLPLRVIYPPDDCPLQGFIGLEAYSEFGGPGPVPRFSLSGPSGNMRLNAAGELLGDGIAAVAPRGTLPVRSAANYPPRGT